MNRQQAINYLLSSGFSEEQINTIEQAFKQEPTTKNDLGVDAISRVEVIEEINSVANDAWDEEQMRVDLIAEINALPSVTPQLSSGLEKTRKNSKKLEKNFGELDCISRADARSLICKIDIKHHLSGMSRKAFKDLYNGIDDLPSVTPQEPVLDKIRAEIVERDKKVKAVRSDDCCFFTADEILVILDKYKAESEKKE